MEISIKIDGGEAGAVSSSSGAGGAAAAGQGAGAPPPEVAAAAAAAGAIDAGPAKIPPGAGGLPGTSSGDLEASQATLSGDAAAGAAPGYAQDAPQVVVEESTE